MILQDQEGVLAWVSERLAVAMRQARFFGLYKPLLIYWELLYTCAVRNSIGDKMQDNQREELIYLAGLFDGEGTICIQKDSRPLYKDNGKNWNPIYNVTVRIGMIDENAIRGYRNFFGVGYIDCEKVYHKFRPMWRYSVRAKDQVQLVISQLRYHIRVKQPQADLALRYFKECPSQRGRFLSPEVLAKKEQFYIAMKTLNGVVDSPATTKRRGRGQSVRVSDSLISQVTVRGESEVVFPPSNECYLINGQ